MMLIPIIFYVFATIAVCSGLMVVASSNPVRGALFLVLTFFAMAGIWLLLHAEFLALILVLVYVGAVMTLFLFVVMMLRVNVVKLREGFVSYLPIAVLIILVMVGLIIMVVGPARFNLLTLPAPALAAANYSNVSELGMLLYTEYAYPFEISAVVLLTAIIAAICLTHRDPKSRRGQRINDQIAVRREDRVKLLKMPAEKKLKPSERGS